MLVQRTMWKKLGFFSFSYHLTTAVSSNNNNTYKEENDAHCPLCDQHLSKVIARLYTHTQTRMYALFVCAYVQSAYISYANGSTRY